MATPPKITRTELVHTIARIVNRRLKVDDPDAELLPDPAQADPREVLDYLHKHTRAPGWVLDADVCDALTLNVWLWWEDRRRELAWLKRGKQRGLFLSQLGSPLGITSRTGVNDRIDRLEALLRFDRPDEKLTREARRVARLDQFQGAAEGEWIRDHNRELGEVAEALLDAAERYGPLDDEDRQWLDELAVDLRDDAFSPASMAVLGMAAAEVRTCPRVLALDSTRPYAVHHVLNRVDQLRAEFADIGNQLQKAARRTLPGKDPQRPWRRGTSVEA